MFKVFLLVISTVTQQPSVFVSPETFPDKATCEVAASGYITGFNTAAAASHGEFLARATACDTQEHFDATFGTKKQPGQDI